MPDADDGSITRWIAGVKGGDLAAAQPLWERYFARMVELARSRLRDPDGPGDDDLLAQAVGSEPTPEFTAMVAEGARDDDPQRGSRRSSPALVPALGKDSGRSRPWARPDHSRFRADAAGGQIEPRPTGLAPPSGRVVRSPRIGR